MWRIGQKQDFLTGIQNFNKKLFYIIFSIELTTNRTQRYSESYDATLIGIDNEVFGGEKLPYFKACVKPAKYSLLQCLRCSKEGNKDNETDRDKYEDKDKQIKDKDKQIKEKENTTKGERQLQI